MQFELLTTDGAARRGRLTLAHGVVETPVFMPVGTYGTVKAMTPRDLNEIGPAGRAHIGEINRLRGLRCCVSNRENRQRFQCAVVGNRAHGGGAGEEQRLHAAYVDLRADRIDDRGHRLRRHGSRAGSRSGSALLPWYRC